MVPLALAGGMPSTGCMCADGGFKLVCAHVYRGLPRAEHAAIADGPQQRDCCRHSSDCCGEPHDGHVARSASGGDCCNGCELPGIAGERPCCTPVFSAPSATLIITAVPPLTEQALAVVAAEPVALQSLAAHAALQLHESDTGPPIDRVIALRCLLI